jgi:hypothetical protein
MQLSAGTASLFVRVTDNMGAVTTYYIQPSLTISSNDDVVKNIVDSLNSNNCGNQFVNKLQTGDIQLTSQLVNGLASSLNTIALSISSNSSNSSNLPSLEDRVSAREAMVSAVVSLPVSEISSVKVVASCLSVVTNTIGENSASSAVIYHVTNY